MSNETYQAITRQIKALKDKFKIEPSINLTDFYRLCYHLEQLERIIKENI